MKTYCDYCRKEVGYRIEKRAAKHKVRGEVFELTDDVCICEECGEELWVSEVDNANLIRAYDAYREAHNLLKPAEIRAIREKYGLSQVAFARLLGFGDKTVARYESGSIQDEAPNTLMRLMDDSYCFEKLFMQNKDVLTEFEQVRVRNALRALDYVSFSGQSYRFRRNGSVGSIIKISTYSSETDGQEVVAS
ncbi:MAG: type II toxin-antitoxin system MqsA family antitoxin [Clostridia bacterium]|nr:type II toxin-antitoxin system MqsA family antitoxin [Clostridia bacterium]